MAAGLAVFALLLLELYLLPWLSRFLPSCKSLQLLSGLLLFVDGLPPLLSRHLPQRRTFHPILTPFLLGSSLLLFLTAPQFC